MYTEKVSKRVRKALEYEGFGTEGLDTYGAVLDTLAKQGFKVEIKALFYHGHPCYLFTLRGEILALKHDWQAGADESILSVLDIISE